jgi:hypothetical protein
MTAKELFENQLREFVATLQKHISSDAGEWTVKGFIDVYKNVYSISNDTKIVSKVLEIHIFPEIMKFAASYGYKVVLPTHQNYYPDITFIKSDDDRVRFAVDFKTTYRNLVKPHLCNGFTLGSHGKYFEDRQSTKNIQYPYASYLGHFCLGIIYDRMSPDDLDDTKIYSVDQLNSITSVIGNFQFFVAEKWKIASDRSGSGNTANIGSINNIHAILNGRGMFSLLGESVFDEYWMNYKKISIPDGSGGSKRILNLKDFVEYKGGDTSLIVQRSNKIIESNV